MRLSLAIATLVLSCSLAAASPWEDYVQRRRGGDPRQSRWVLCVRQEDFTAQEAQKDPVFQKLLCSGDFLLEPLGRAVAQDLWDQKAWGGNPHWLLLSPEGQEAARGAGRPRGAEVLDGIHKAGAKPRWEAREAFLKEHPEQGEARLEALNFAFQVLRLRLQALDREGKVQVPAWHLDPRQRTGMVLPRVSFAPGSHGESMADELYQEAADSIEKVLGLPGWEREAFTIAAHLGYWDVGQSFRLRRLFAQAAGRLEECLRQDPHDVDLAAFWVEAADAGGLALGGLGGLCQPVPGSIWPDPGLLGRFLEPGFRNRDWDGILKLLDELAPQAPPEPMTAHGWEGYCRLLCAIQAQRAVALAGRGSWDVAGSALEEARHWGGSHGAREALLHRGSLFTGPGGDPNSWRQLLAQVLGRNGEPPPMPAAAPPLRLVASGMPRWIVAWGALRAAPELGFWSPGELRWEVADREAHEKSLARHGGEPGPRWMLCRGEELLASGRTCPDPRTLAAILESVGPSMLHRLQGVLETQPDHLAARRQRFELVMRRMPDRRLEPLLAQDAARALITLDFDPQAPWKPDPAIWAEAAQKALPALEETIRSWPNRSYLWKAWVSWARFHPAQPSVLALAQSVAFWCPRSDWRSWLPYQVQRQVASEMRRQGKFFAMRDWFGGVWDTMDRRPLAGLHKGERQWVMERRKEEETAVFQPLRDALAALGCTQEQADLERVFSEMMGREPSRRP